MDLSGNLPWPAASVQRSNRVELAMGFPEDDALEAVRRIHLVSNIIFINR